MVLKYFKILYIELFYSFFSIVFLCKLDNLNSELLGKNDLSILTYNNYQSLYFFIGAFILIIFGFYIFIYRFKYILDMEINSFGELVLEFAIPSLIADFKKRFFITAPFFNFNGVNNIWFSIFILSLVIFYHTSLTYLFLFWETFSY